MDDATIGDSIPVAVTPSAGDSSSVRAIPPAPPPPAIACRITFSGVDPSEPPKVEIRAWLARLGALTAPMTAGHVVIDAGGGDPRKPRQYQVRMELTMPDGLVVVGTEHPSNKPHEDLYCAIRNAFRAARRQLEEQVLARPAETPRVVEAPHVTEAPRDAGAPQLLAQDAG